MKSTTLKRLIAACLPLVVINLGSFAHADDPPPSPRATVDLSAQVYLGDVSELEREKYFNIHSSYSTAALTPSDLEFLYDELNLGVGRQFWSPFSAYSGVAPYPTEVEAAAAGGSAVQAHSTSSNFPYRSHRMVITDQPRNVLEWDENPILAAEWAVRYFKHYFGDDYRPIFYEPMNEPFVHAGDWVPPALDQAEVRLKMTTWFKEIGRAFSLADMPVNVVGYSSAWPSMELWDFGHWDSRMKMFMDEAGDYIDAFSVHLYDDIKSDIAIPDSFRSGSNASAILDLMETYSNIKWGATKPHALTEYGGIPRGWPTQYSPGQSAASINSYSHLLFGFLERQDRILTSIPFVTSKSPWFYNNNDFQPYGADLWRPDPTKIVGTKVNGFLLTEKVKFYELWADVRGNRTQVKSNDPDLRAHAFVHGPTAFICLNNLEQENKDVALDFVSGLVGLQNVTIKRLVVPKNLAASLTEETHAVAPANIVLAPHETAILRYDFSSPIQFSRDVHTSSYYTTTHLQPIVASQNLNFTFNGIELCDDFCDDFFDGCFEDANGDGFDDDEEYAILRMSISRTHDKSKAPVVMVNGDAVAVPDDWAGYDQVNRENFFGSIEIPVETDDLEPTTNVTVRFPDSGGRVSSLVLVVEKCEAHSPIPVQAIALPETFEINKDKSDKLRVTFTPYNATDKYIIWSSSDESIATVGEDGTVYPVVPGAATITATSNDGGFIASSLVTVRDRLSIPDRVTILTDLSDVIQSDSYLIDMEYSAPVQRDIAVEMRVDGNWKGIEQITVPPGTGVRTLNLTFPQPIPPGTGTWIGSIRTVGGDWRTTLDSHKQDNTIIRPDPALVDTITVVTDLNPTVSQAWYQVDVEYTVEVARDIRIDLWGPGPNGPGTQWLAWGKKDLLPGQGVTSVPVWNNFAPTPGPGYRWDIALRELGTGTTKDFVRIENAVITSAPVGSPDTIAFVSVPASLPSSATYSVDFNYTADTDRDLVIEAYDGPNWIGIFRTTVPPTPPPTVGVGTVTLNFSSPRPVGSTLEFKSSIRPVGKDWRHIIQSVNSGPIPIVGP